jgi:hypothetical protein
MTQTEATREQEQTALALADRYGTSRCEMDGEDMIVALMEEPEDVPMCSYRVDPDGLKTRLDAGQPI